MTADGLTVDGGTNDNTVFLQSAGTQYITSRNGSSNGSIRLRSTDGTTTKNVANFSGNGDISFYEDTGTTPKFFWDASAESLGIGTSSPSRKFTVQGASGDTLPARIIGGSGTTTSGLEFQDPSTTGDYKVQVGSVGDDLYLRSWRRRTYAHRL